MYQSGWAPVDTALGVYGPYSQIGLICARPPSATRTPATRNNRPTERSAYVGHRREPTTLCSVRPGPGNWVCFCRQTTARCTLSSPTISAGTTSTWTMNRRPSMLVARVLAAEHEERQP